ncbi:MAG: hypothetical protein F6K30_13580 [Cyanothece sp. SIO2G6]|nr:hypothetical protein [Cyanothece sp. SIO2G6]
MQEILTFLYNAVLSVGSGYLGVSFVLEMVDFWQRCEPKGTDQTDSTALEVEAIALPPSQAAPAFEPHQSLTRVVAGEILEK